MTPLELPRLSHPEFSIEAAQGDRSFSLCFRGNADMASIEPLDEYLHAVHAQAGLHQVTSVIVDFRALEFMNSSCFKCFVEWLGKVQDLDASQRYRVVFDSNAEMHWQRRSLNALRSFAMDVVTIEAR